MNRSILWAFIFMAVPMVAVASENIKLPYEAGQRFVVVQGYNESPTHINKDLYAIDFSQNSCDAYGKLAVAANDGKILLAQEAGYNGGYGAQVLVVNDSRIVARYAHLIPGTIPASLATGESVAQGEPIGEIGNTGLVAGAACPTHPGTHLHFAMYGENADGSFSPFFPEPISNYVGIAPGRWYLSDNALAIATVPGATAIISRVADAVFESGDTGANTGGGSGGGASAVSASPAPVAVSSSDASTTSLAPSSTQENISTTTALVATTTLPTVATATATATFNSSTLAIDLSWSPPVSSSTTTYQIFSSSTLIATTAATNFSYQLSASDFTQAPLAFTITTFDGTEAISTLPTAQVSLPDWWIQIQPIDNTNSNPSWYSDNWYNLGTGFYGEIRALTLEGFINDPSYFASHLYLDEYLDANYTQLNQSYTISDRTPFTAAPQKITINDLNIPLQPNKYYRLRTYQDYQNRSIVLAGTSATGTAMWDGFIPGISRVEYQYPFYPYLAAIMIPNYPPLQLPSAPSAGATTTFDSLNSAIVFFWNAATDPDTTSSLLTYQVNLSTSTILDPSRWHPAGNNLSTSTPVAFGNAYTIGIRAVDDLGNIGSPLIEQWNFPAGYTPAPKQLDHSAVLSGGDGSAQEITLTATTTVKAVEFWTNGLFGIWCCSDSAISIHRDVNGNMGATFATSETLRTGPYAGNAGHLYQFDSPPTLSPGTYWFAIENPTNLNDIQIFGSPGDSYPDGKWSTATGQDAYFQIEE